MSTFSYSSFDRPEQALPVAAPVPAVTVPAPVEPDPLIQQAERLSMAIPGAFADLLNHPGIAPDRKIDLVRELVGLNEGVNVSDQQVAAASPELREAAEALKNQKIELANREKEAQTLVVAPVTGMEAVRARIDGAGQLPRLDFADLGGTTAALADAPQGFNATAVPASAPGKGQDFGVA